MHHSHPDRPAGDGGQHSRALAHIVNARHSRWCVHTPRQLGGWDSCQSANGVPVCQQAAAGAMPRNCFLPPKALREEKRKGGESTLLLMKETTLRLPSKTVKQNSETKQRRPRKE